MEHDFSGDLTLSVEVVFYFALRTEWVELHNQPDRDRMRLSRLIPKLETIQCEDVFIGRINQL